MAKPPATPPSSDIDGVHRDRVDRRLAAFDGNTEQQMEAEARENVGQPERTPVPPSLPQAPKPQRSVDER